MNNNSKLLASAVIPEKDWGHTAMEDVFREESSKPLVLFSLIPKYPNEEKINLPLQDFKKWLKANDRGYYPESNVSLYYLGDDYDLKMDGLVIKKIRDNQQKSYFEVTNHAFVEAGFPDSIFKRRINNSQSIIFANLTFIIGYEMLLLGFAKRFYEMAKYHDEVLLQISFVNVLGFELRGFHDAKEGYIRFDYPINKQHKNFKLTYKFKPRTLNDTEILSIAKHHSLKICRAFGHEMDCCFVNDELDTSVLYRLIN